MIYIIRTHATACDFWVTYEGLDSDWSRRVLEMSGLLNSQDNPGG